MYLPRAQGDQSDVVTEGTLLNLVDKLGQLWVCAAAVVNLETHLPDTDYDRTSLTSCLRKTLKCAFHLRDMFLHQFIICIIFINAKPKQEKTAAVFCSQPFATAIFMKAAGGCIYLLLVFDSSSLWYSAMMSSSSPSSSGSSVWSPVLSCNSWNASSSSQV